MALSVVMPALEMAQETGKVVAWRKQDGDPVTKGEALLEIETDKAVVEIEAQGSGILGGVSARAGDVVPVGQTIAWLLAPGEAVPAVSAPTQTGRRSDSAPRSGGPATGRPAPTAGAGPAGGGRMSPKARRLAQEHGVDVATLTGSGPGGEILTEDILQAVAGRPAATGQAEPLSAIGRLMAERTTQSWTTVPHFFVTRDVDATALNTTREEIKGPIEASHGVKVTHTDLMVAAVARTLKKHPRMNASWVNGAVRANDTVNVGVAMAVNDGVVAPVVARADTLSVDEIARQRLALTDRARANKLQPSDLSGGTFTISNLGMFDVDRFTAIIVQPQAGILAVGAIKDRPVVRAGQVVIRPTMTLTLSSDHRVVDGARAAEFLNDLIAALDQLEWLRAVSVTRS